MAIDFPSSPTAGQIYTFAGVTYTFTAQGVWAVVGTGGASGTSKITVQKFTASGTYTPTPGTQFAVIECVGGGGGGGGQTSASGNATGAAGGGAGSYSCTYATAAQIGASQTVTIGAGGAAGTSAPTAGGSGGDTSVGSLCIGKGGSGGVSGPNATGGVGGVAGTGDVTIPGGGGGSATYMVAVNVGVCSGIGGASYFGGGGAGVSGGGATAGNAGLAYGSGGSGGMAFNGAPIGGGLGAAGIVIVTEYNIAAAGPQGPAGPMGGTTGVSAPGGRLTLSSTLPVMTSTLANQGIIYYLPYIGDRIPIYDGANMVMTTIPAGLSVATTNTTKSPAAIGVSKVNDWFVWSDSGTIRLGHGPDWTSDTARSAGTALVMVNGIWLNNVAITNGPAASRGTYVGTTRSNATSTLDWIYGTAGAPPVAGNFRVWNVYNRVRVSANVQDTTAQWSETVTAFLQFNRRTTYLVDFVMGLQEDTVSMFITFEGFGAATQDYWRVGFGIDSNTATTGPLGITAFASSAVGLGVSTSYGTSFLGYHFIAALQRVSGSTLNAYGEGTGLTVDIWM